MSREIATLTVTRGRGAKLVKYECTIHADCTVRVGQSVGDLVSGEWRARGTLRPTEDGYTNMAIMRAAVSAALKSEIASTVRQARRRLAVRERYYERRTMLRECGINDV